GKAKKVDALDLPVLVERYSTIALIAFIVVAVSGIARTVVALDLAEVVIAGPADLFDGVFLDAATRALHDRTLEGVFADVPIRLSDQRDIVVRGAVVTVLAAQLGVS
ncbi:MAG TPA: hypothetical protein VN041_11220, partial [Microbacterium sp.]|nr:hypothetical protein [Microbacterium sp.]